MPTAQAYSTAGQETGRVELPEALFGADVNTHVLYEAVKSYLGNQRQGTHKTKNRHEVSGQKSKLYKQKGTGRARAGSATSGTRVGGGRIFGPRPRDYRTQLPARVRRQALRAALSDRAAGAQVHVVDDLRIERPHTQTVARLLGSMGLADKRVLWVSAREDGNLLLSCRNLQRLELTRAQELNAYTVLRDEQNKYVFRVHPRATKSEIKKAVEELFDVRVVGVTTASGLGKVKRLGRSIGRRPSWKRAIVRVAAGQKIDIYEAV